MAEIQIEIDPARVRDAEERFAKKQKSKKAPAPPLAGTLGNELLKQVALPPNGELRSKNWFPAKVSDVISDVEWAIQYTCCRTSGSRSCTEATCPVMGAGKFKFPWHEEEAALISEDSLEREAHMVSAPRFCHKLVQWATRMRTAPNFWHEASKHFDADSDYKANVEPAMKLLMFRILCVYSHIFHHHWIHHHKAKTEEHFNHVFKHFIWFTTECQLLTAAEMAPLQPVIDCMFEKERKIGQAP